MAEVTKPRPQIKSISNRDAALPDLWPQLNLNGSNGITAEAGREQDNTHHGMYGCVPSISQRSSMEALSVSCDSADVKLAAAGTATILSRRPHVIAWHI